MIELSKAIAKGKEFLNEVYGKPEEIILDSAQGGEDQWSIRFRFQLSVEPINSLQKAMGINKRIFFKTVKIDSKGEVISVSDNNLLPEQASDLESQAS